MKSTTIFLAAMFFLEAANAQTPFETYKGISDASKRAEFIVEFHNSQCHPNGMKSDGVFALQEMIMFEAAEAGHILNFEPFLLPAVRSEAAKDSLAYAIVAEIPIGSSMNVQVLNFVRALGCKEFQEPYQERGSFLNALFRNMILESCGRLLHKKDRQSDI